MTEPETRADRFFGATLGISLDGLLAAISPERPSGESLQYDRLYEQIREARREDDPSVPQGTWQCDLKRADWDKASKLCAEALASRSKDMQLVAWLLEARINLDGFAALAPCLVLLNGLCQRYWDSLHPNEENGGQEMRANLVAWINTKLLSRLRQIAITAAGGARDYGWSDWEMARRLESSRAASRNEQPQGTGIAEISAALTLTPGDILHERAADLAAAIAAIDGLQQTLDRCFTAEPPGLSALRGLLCDIGNWLGSELTKRGRLTQESTDKPAQDEEASGPISDSLEQAMADRAQAYAYLAAAAEFLMRLEPHSPVPYLVRRAIEWGQLNTVELYEELFVHRNGQISIFDLLGLPPQAKGKA